eukprot:CAMPEP_0197708778 /NCGR_PEP_ID=MMETSP1338-20131121/128123_1 /TAXON_ID=43686 ORGANISM="Pelagodinium beii, Strain RCC1491" /NCGR_SAMPLE_ID=MMETSP1338 /ASSEMBLY_ACC=CAM_ASM_000754 /LENGTH=327 /DNA_ID=CAMNT_0043292709 /DNA_START=64 /DNA_END=1048 /DNA_ORIENTATION=-
MAVRRSRSSLTATICGAAALCTLHSVSWSPAKDLAIVAVADAEDAVVDNGFLTKVFAAAAQGATAAIVAAILSAVCEPLVNRLLVKRMTVAQAWQEITFKLVSNFFLHDLPYQHAEVITFKARVNFFLTTFPTNMLKFPVFEIINMALTFTSLTGSVRGIVNGFLFCSIMLPVTNYRFRKSMGWEIKASLLYQAYVPTVTRDIIYGWARGVVAPVLTGIIAPESFEGKALVFGITIWAACIISSPCNEWRGYTLQPKDRKLSFGEYFKPINYMRSTGIGATIMGVALMVGMLVTPYAESLFELMKENTLYSGVAVVILLALLMKANK